MKIVCTYESYHQYKDILLQYQNAHTLTPTQVEYMQQLAAALAEYEQSKRTNT